MIGFRKVADNIIGVGFAEAEACRMIMGALDRCEKKRVIKGDKS